MGALSAPAAALLPRGEEHDGSGAAAGAAGDGSDAMDGGGDNAAESVAEGLPMPATEQEAAAPEGHMPAAGRVPDSVLESTVGAGVLPASAASSFSLPRLPRAQATAFHPSES